jgi:hypothetical protein
MVAADAVESRPRHCGTASLVPLFYDGLKRFGKDLQGRTVSQVRALGPAKSLKT